MSNEWFIEKLVHFLNFTGAYMDIYYSFVPSLMFISNMMHWLLFSLIPFLLWKLSTHTDDVYYKVCLIFDTKAIYNMSHSCGQWNLKTCILLKFVIKLDRHYPKQCNNILTISTLIAGQVQFHYWDFIKKSCQPNFVD